MKRSGPTRGDSRRNETKRGGPSRGETARFGSRQDETASLSQPPTRTIERMTMDTLQVHAVGSKCEAHGVPLVIVGICIRSAGVQYEVAWWDGRNHHVEWLYDFEVEYNTRQTKVGFAPAAD